METSLLEDKIKVELARISLMLQGHAGGVELAIWEPSTATVTVKLLGNCSHCALSALTLSQGVGAALKRAFPQIRTVRAL